MKYLANPLNIEYKYQFCKNRDETLSVNREAADPSLVLFRGIYYLYPSMSCGFWWSKNLETWAFHKLSNMPVYDYAPDVRPVGDWLYFCASNHGKTAHFRTHDPFSDEYERIDGSFPFWDPDLFEDDNGRLYFYHGSSPKEPIHGVELDRETLMPLTEQLPLFANDEEHHGYERRGEDHVPAHTAEEKRRFIAGIAARPDLDPLRRQMAIDYISDRGYVEGSWMTKHGGKYYLQYGTPGAQFNTYGDGVYVSDSPLGPFKLAKNNPFSYKPGGFIPGAGHGSTVEDQSGHWWHISTMRISVNHVFERRIGMWPVDWDRDGEMFCNQRYGDWVYTLDRFRENVWAEPEWMLLSFGKGAIASSEAAGCEAKKALDENIRTWWKAGNPAPGQWLEIDLGMVYDVRAVQVNFADDHPDVRPPEGTEFHGDIYNTRWIDEASQPTRWLLESSENGEKWFTFADRRGASGDLSHDLAVREDGIHARFLKLTVISVPYGQPACVSGLRVFGLGSGEKPSKAGSVNVEWASDLDVYLTWDGNAMGYEVLFGHAPDKLYHSYEVFDRKVHLGGLVSGQDLYIRVDSFNESGITHGDVIKC